MSQVQIENQKNSLEIYTDNKNSIFHNISMPGIICVGCGSNVSLEREINCIYLLVSKLL